MLRLKGVIYIGDAYVCSAEVFFNMKRLFSYFYENWSEFRYAVEVKRQVTVRLKKYSSSTCMVVLKGTKATFDVNTNLWYIGSLYPTKITFSKIFKYEGLSSMVYLGGVLEEECHNDEDAGEYYLPDISSDYPKVFEVLVPNTNSKWSIKKSVPDVFEQLKHSMGLTNIDSSLDSL